MTDVDLVARIMARVIEDDAGCWIWQGSKTGGYGQISFGGKRHATHRVMLAAHLGHELPHPLTLQVDHLCRVRACCNPAHLELVTPGENKRRGICVNSTKTHCPSGHAYDSTNTYHNPDGSRQCRLCHLESHRAHKARKREYDQARYRRLRERAK